MADPFLGEIKLFGGNYAPVGWAFCDGTLIAIDQNPALFNLIGTVYGGDGQQTFKLPDLRGRVPVHVGSNGTSSYLLGQAVGVEDVTVQGINYPAHSHTAIVSNAAGAQPGPAGNMLGASSTTAVYTANGPNSATLAPAVVVPTTGGGLPHGNLQPLLVISYIIALQGTYPSQG
jgi:microcystin-dependent protein